MKDFDTWEEASAYAHAVANRMGLAIDAGSKRLGMRRWIVRMIPNQPANRSGWELRCEVVEPEAK